jgi:type II secretory pathway predicted ATPase ExeA
MYEHFYGLRDRPFELTSDPRFLFFSRQHREVLANLEYGLSAAKAVTVLVGEAGTGKTTLLSAALASERCKTVDCVYLRNPALTRAEFIEMLGARLQLSTEAWHSKTALLEQLERSLLDRRDSGRTLALVIDEAQSLSHELLEEIRLLANIETPAAKLLPLVLAGQPEFATRLNDPALRQLKQRVALRCELVPLTLNETASYIASRIRVAGGEASRLFTREAVGVIFAASGGIPRTISVICDNALVNGFALDRRPIDSAIVRDVCADFDLTIPSDHGEAKDAGPRAVQPSASELSPTVPAIEEVAPLPLSDTEPQPEAPARFSLFGLRR